MGDLEVNFYATLFDKGMTVGMYADGTARIVLMCDASQLPEVIKLAAFGREKPMRVNVKIEGAY